MNELRQSFDISSYLTGDTFGNFVKTFIVILLLLVVSRIMKRLVRKSAGDDLKTQYYWSKGVTYFAFFLGLLFLSNIWISGIGSIGTFLGLVGAGLAIALQDPIVDLVAWLFIAIRRPFSVGDRVEIGDTAGDVIDIGVMTFTLLEIGNWVNASDYYEKVSSLQFLDQIEIPTLLVSAENDPMLSESCYPRAIAEKSPLFHLEVAEYGGHVGFANDLSFERFYYADRVSSWLE